MKYLLDTDHVSILQRHAGPQFAAISARMAACVAGDVVYSIVSFHEQVVGAHTFINRARTVRELIRSYAILHEIQRTFAGAHVVPFEQPEATVFDSLKARRIRVSTMDLRLAASALSSGLILLTRNVRDFSQVPGLVIENWTK